jgi:hypothetical protein
MAHESRHTHKRALARIGLVLEENGIGREEPFTINEIAESAHLHHQTVRNDLEEIYYVQHFVPEIDILHKDRRMLVKVKNLGKYVKLATKPGHSALVKLFHAKAYFGRRVPISILDSEEIRSLKEVGDWVIIDHRTGTIGLSMEGSEYAFKEVEKLADIRDKTIVDFAAGIAELRKEIIQPPGLSLEELMAVAIAEDSDNARRWISHKLRSWSNEELLKALEDISRYLERSQVILQEIRNTLYEHTPPLINNNVLLIARSTR